MEEFDISNFEGKSVREMNPDAQPREKLLKYGADSLSNAELLAILLRTGSQKMNVIQTAHALLDHFNGLRNLARQDSESVKVIPGIAKVKAITLEAIFELSRRIQQASLGEKIVITSPEDAAAYFMPIMRDLTQEQFLVAFLNNAKVLTGFKKISIGNRTGTIVDPADVMRKAILHHANTILLVHNHPSGHAKASKADIRLTKRISNVSKELGIPVDDHIIIAGDMYVSLRNEDLL